MPKGDADLLRADIDDGYTGIANLLVEALACCPLTSTEYAVCLFIMRRTYGWAKSKDRATGKMDRMIAEEIASGTARPKRTVETAIASLKRANVILHVQVEPANVMAYGMNPNVAEWGLPTPEWAWAKTQLREARDSNIYTPNHVYLYAELRTPVRENEYTCTRKRVQGQASNVDTARVPGALQPVLQPDTHQENDSPASGDAGSEQPKSTRKPRAPKPAAEDTPAQAAIRRCYEAVFGAGAVPGGSKYSSLAKLYQEHGEDVFRKLADHIRGREQPEGTEQNAWFAKLVREELSAKWKWIEDTGPDKRRGAFIRLRDGVSYTYEADWSFGQQYEVNAQRERGNWNEATGCTKTPANGFCCDDGHFYPTGQERERWVA